MAIVDAWGSLVEDFAGQTDVDTPVFVVHIGLQSPLPPGQYRCLFTAEGAELGSVPLVVG